MEAAVLQERADDAGVADDAGETFQTRATSPYSTLTATEYDGESGRRDHTTRLEEGTIPTAAITHLKGESGEIRGEHRNRIGRRWDTFLADIRKNGIQEPILILKDPGSEAVISEGNHRLDAAVELGLEEVPVDIRYFGKSEQEGLAYTTSQTFQTQITPEQDAEYDAAVESGDVSRQQELVDDAASAANYERETFLHHTIDNISTCSSRVAHQQ